VQPGLNIADPDIEVLPQPGFGDRALRDGEQIGRGDVNILALAGDLVRLGISRSNTSLAIAISPGWAT